MQNALPDQNGNANCNQLSERVQGILRAQPLNPLTKMNFTAVKREMSTPASGAGPSSADQSADRRSVLEELVGQVNIPKNELADAARPLASVLDAEDVADIALIEARKDEPTIPFDEAMKLLGLMQDATGPEAVSGGTIIPNVPAAPAEVVHGLQSEAGKDLATEAGKRQFKIVKGEVVELCFSGAEDKEI